jgi:tape measure domain-containing protein
MASIRDLFVTIGVNADTKDVIKLQNSLKKTVTVAKWAGIAIAGAMAAASGWAVKLAADFEQTEMSFEVMLGSIEKANELINELRLLAAKSPFTFLETTKHAKKLLAYGIEANKVVDTMKTLGNIASGVGKDRLPFLTLALGQIRAKGVLAGQELRQLTESGIPIIDELSKVTGFSKGQITDQTKDLGITFDQVYKAMQNMTKEGGKFYNLMERQNTTMLGQVSNIQDVLEEIGTTFGKELNKSIKPFVESIRIWLETNKELIIQNFVDYAESFGDALEMVTSNIDKIIAALKLLSVWVGLALAPIIINKAIAAFGMLFTAIMSVNAAKAIFWATWIGIAAIFAFVLGVIEDLYYYFSGGNSLVGEMAKHNPALKTLLDILGGIGKVIAGIVVGITKWDWSLFLEGWSELYDIISGIVSKLIKLQSMGLNKIGNFVLGLFGTSGAEIREKIQGMQAMGGVMAADFGRGLNSVTNNRNASVNNNITINAAGANADQVATMVEEKLNQSYATASEDF